MVPNSENSKAKRVPRLTNRQIKSDLIKSKSVNKDEGSKDVGRQEDDK